MIRPVEARGARLALIGADTPEGTKIREVLAGRGVSGDRVDLFGRSRGEAVLTEYAGEARLIHEPDPSELAAHDVVFLCERGPLTSRALSHHAPDTLIVDVVGCTADREGTPVVHMDINPEDAGAGGGVVAVPHGISAMLAELLHCIDASRRVRSASATVMRPASDFGGDGLEELRRQTLGLFNFGKVPQATFGAQLAFNLIPERLRDAGGALDHRIQVEVERIVGWAEPRLGVRVVNVPVFHGHAAFVRVELQEPPDEGVDDAGSEDGILSALDAASGIERTTDGDAGTPVDVADDRRTVVADVSRDGAGAYWVWLVAGELGSVSGEQAVRLAGTLRSL